MPLTRRIFRGSAGLALALLAAAFFAPAAALAHAFLDHADPAVGSTVHGSPAAVQAWFTQALEPAFSNLRVVDQNGAQVDKRDSAVSPADPTVLKVSLPALQPGKYKVFWHVLSADTHTTDGTFTFDVAP